MRYTRVQKATLILVGLVFAALLGLAVPGCGPPHQLVNLWKDPEYPKAPLRNVLVLVMKKDPTIRRMWEDAFTTALKADGVTATSSYRLFPSSLPDTQAVVGAVRREHFDGVIVTRRLPNETQAEYVPPDVRSEPVTRFDPWLNMFYTDYVDLYEPGYVENETVLRHRTDVWTTGTEGHLIWSGTSEVINPNSSDEVNRYVAKMVVPNLAKTKVI